jgi:cell division ATPase FtsA
LQRNTRIGIPDIGFVNSIPAELKHPMFATSLGLLKHGVQINEYEVIGYEEEEQKAEGRKQKAKKKKEVGVENLPPTPKKQKIGNSKTIWDNIKGFLDDLTEKTS